jgi:hypothetical protein
MRSSLAAFLLCAGLILGPASSAQASVGYELDASKPSRALPGPPRGLAINQTTQDVYVAIVSVNPAIGTPGEINRFNSDLTADGVFAKGGGYYTGVAVNPLTQAFYASQIKLDLPQGTFGIPRLDRFSSTGVSEGTFPLADSGSLPPIATDSTGRIIYPNSDGHKIEIFSSAGVLQQALTCSTCPGGAFGRPMSVATDFADNLYVADMAPDRVIKLSPSGGGSYSYASTLQSGRGAVAVGADPSTGDVLVGDLPSGRNYHIVAYDSSGVQFDDFGAGLFRDPPQEPAGTATNLAYQMAVNATTHKLYVGEADKFYVFEKTMIEPPTTTIKPASSVGQLVGTLNASVDANGHAALECEFEYTLDTDTGFASATSVPCTQLPDGSLDTSLSVKASGLSPDTAYSYRLTVLSNAGSTTSSAQTFETLPELPPTVTTEAATDIAQTTATLRGKVNPHGGSTSSCRFEFGLGKAYGSSTTCPLPGPGTTAVAIFKKVSGLTPATTYHYRLVVTTNAGTVEGDDVSFTTASPPSNPEPEVPATSPAAPPAVIAPTPTPGPTTSPRPRRCKKGFHRRKVRGKIKCVRRKRSRKHRHRS